MEGHANPPLVTPDTVIQWEVSAISSLRQRGIRRPRAKRMVLSLDGALRWIARQLDGAHGTPHLGNFSNPTDEFVFIVLSRKTPERAYIAAFRSLKRFGNWDVVQGLGPARIAKVIRGGGLESKKARAIVSGLRAIESRFGVSDLRLARDLQDEELFAFLASLPEVGPKTARCVMLYSFGRPVFPVDAHVGRVLARLGCLRRIGIDLGPMDHKERQRVLENLIPPDLRYGLHVNLIAHGRAVCKAARPVCKNCSLAPRCAHAKAFRTHDRRVNA